MTHHEILRTRDGCKISVSLYLPQEKNGRLLLIGPGAGVTQPFYEPFAVFCMNCGYTVVTFDYRGTGASGAERIRDFRATLRQWASHDLDAVLLYARSRFPGQELIFVGHCVSGEIAGIAPASEYIHRVVLVSSALPCWQLWPRRSKPRIWLMKILAPLISAWYGYFPGSRLRFLRDMPKGVVAEYSDWCNRPNGLFDVFPDNNYRKLNVPLLAFSFTDDWFSPPKAVAALLGHFSAARTRWLHLQPTEAGLPQIGHDGFFDPAGKALWQMMLDWIETPEPVKGYFF